MIENSLAGLPVRVFIASLGGIGSGLCLTVATRQIPCIMGSVLGLVGPFLLLLLQTLDGNGCHSKESCIIITITIVLVFVAFVVVVVAMFVSITIIVRIVIIFIISIFVCIIVGVITITTSTSLGA